MYEMSKNSMHILERVPALRLPTLERLGLANALSRETSTLPNPGWW